MKADGVIDSKEEFMNQIYRDFTITISELEYISNIDDIQAHNIVLRMSDEKKASSVLMQEDS